MLDLGSGILEPMWDIPDCLILADRLDRIDHLRRLLRALAAELKAS